MKQGRPKGTHICDFIQLLRLLNLLYRKGLMNTYQLHHNRWLHFDIKKLYRYLRYCLTLDLIELDHLGAGFLPTKWYRLTPRGRAIIECCRAEGLKLSRFGSQ